jgi:hypothetical protein
MDGIAAVSSDELPILVVLQTANHPARSSPATFSPKMSIAIYLPFLQLKKKLEVSLTFPSKNLQREISPA